MRCRGGAYILQGVYAHSDHGHAEACGARSNLPLLRPTMDALHWAEARGTTFNNPSSRRTMMDSPSHRKMSITRAPASLESLQQCGSGPHVCPHTKKRPWATARSAQEHPQTLHQPSWAFEIAPPLLVGRTCNPCV